MTLQLYAFLHMLIQVEIKKLHSSFHSILERVGEGVWGTASAPGHQVRATSGYTQILIKK